MNLSKVFSSLKEHFYFPLLDNIGFPVLAGIFILLFVVEMLQPLRRRKASHGNRILTNAGVASTAIFALRIALIPLMVAVAKFGATHQLGLLYLFDLPYWLSFGIGFLLLDYGNYLWHILNHKIPLLWRFHNVHHTDLDLDVTTAVRFHIGEILFSVLFRGAVVLVIGAPVVLVLIYEIAFEAATNFHHSNLRIPFFVEKRLSTWIVTPRMHGIHHSIVKKETDSNYSVIFNFWDRMHDTIRLNVPQLDINIGVPAYRDPGEQNFKCLSNPKGHGNFRMALYLLERT